MDFGIIFMPNLRKNSKRLTTFASELKQVYKIFFE
jgi:hypothetical protein